MTIHESVMQCLIVTPHVVAEECWISHCYSGSGWNLQFRRHFDDWEIGDVNLLLQKLSSVVILEEREDSVHGQPVEMRSSLFYPAIKCCNLQAQGNIVDEMVIWKTNVPPKVACFGLFATHAYPVE